MFGVGVDVEHFGGAEGAGDVADVQAGAAAGDDQDACSGTGPEVRGDQAPGQGPVVTGRGHGDRVEAGRQRDEHGVGVGHADQVGEWPRIDAPTARVLRTLSSGTTDETAPRELGMSLCTYRRRVAELLVTLDAGSRFQAGLRAGEMGLNRG